MALAAHTLFDHGEFLSASSITVNFLAPVTEGPVLSGAAVAWS
jgi:acyl-coenzyme A thioesterase PaaI-like protein